MKIKKNGKVIRLNESDLKRIVKRVLTEQVNVPIPIGIQSDSSQNTATIKFKDVNVTSVLIGGLVTGGFLLLRNLIRGKKQKQLNSLLADVNVALKKELTPQEYNCISEKLSKMGRITKLNDPKKNKDTIKALNECLGDESRVEEVKTFLDGYIQKIENKKKYLKDLKKIK